MAVVAVILATIQLTNRKLKKNLRPKLVIFQQENYLWNMKTKMEILNENGLTNIDELMDVQFGKPGTSERERFREEARTYVNGHAKTAECRNSQKKQK